MEKVKKMEFKTQTFKNGLWNPQNYQEEHGTLTLNSIEELTKFVQNEQDKGNYYTLIWIENGEYHLGTWDGIDG